MDYPLHNKKRKLLVWQQFEYLDMIPYSLALLMFSGSIYIIVLALEITKHAQ